MCPKSNTVQITLIVRDDPSTLEHVLQQVDGLQHTMVALERLASGLWAPVIPPQKELKCPSCAHGKEGTHCHTASGWCVQLRGIVASAADGGGKPTWLGKGGAGLSVLCAQQLQGVGCWASELPLSRCMHHNTHPPGCAGRARLPVLQRCPWCRDAVQWRRGTRQPSFPPLPAVHTV